jgi:hypothetical protein
MMEAIKVIAHADADGLVQFNVPVPFRGQDIELTVKIRPPVITLEEQMAEYRLWVERTYGSLADDPIERGEQPPISQRLPLE